MYYLIYKTTNKKNGKYYIGAHVTNNINDGYLGSGVALKKAITKYGRENFTKEVLAVCSTKEEMYLLEEKLVDHADELSYNMRRGGKGGWDHIDINGDKNPMKKPNVIKRVVETSRNNGSYYTEKRKQQQQNMTKLAVNHNLGKKRPEHAIIMRDWSKAYWEKNKDKQRDSLSSTFEVVSPDGMVYITNRLQEFCTEHDLTYTALWKTSRTNRAVKKGKAKGWKCTTIQK